MSRLFPLLLVFAWAAAYLPNLGVRTLRLEEGRRATPAREMLASGDFVRPTLYGDTYLNKPPLYFWMVAGVASVEGEVTPLATRIPSVLAALGCAFVALRFARGVLDLRTRRLAALFVLSCATLLDKGVLGEIDATLCLLVAAALSCWWTGHSPERQSTASWLRVGMILGVAALLKGPAGPAIFYLGVGSFLMTQRLWRQMFTVGHAAAIVLMLLPSAAWVAALIDAGVIDPYSLAATWRHQLGMNEAADSLADPAGRVRRLLAHYAEFPLQTAAMLFPAVLWLPMALRRRDDLSRFLACATIAPIVLFWLYPESRPRHVMPAFFPACVLAATVAVDRWRRLALGLCGLSLSASFIVNAVVVPLQAPKSPTMQAVEMSRKIDGPLWTTRTFPGLGEGLYNVQFHLAPDIRGTNVDALMRLEKGYAIVTPEERTRLEAVRTVVEVGAIARKGPVEVFVVWLPR